MSTTAEATQAAVQAIPGELGALAEAVRDLTVSVNSLGDAHRSASASVSRLMELQESTLGGVAPWGVDMGDPALPDETLEKLWQNSTADAPDDIDAPEDDSDFSDEEVQQLRQDHGTPDDIDSPQEGPFSDHLRRHTL